MFLFVYLLLSMLAFTGMAHGTEWETYALGDCWVFSDSSNCPYELYRTNWPNSLATKLLEQTKGSNLTQNALKEKGLVVLAGLIRNMTDHWTEILGQKKTCVVHLRLGDVIEDSSNSVNQIWSEETEYIGPTGFKRVYTYPKSYYEKAFEEAQPKVVHIVGALKHFDQVLSNRNSTYGNKSKQYLHKVKSFWEHRIGSSNVHVNTNLTPDQTIKMITSSKCFIPGGGGFSTLATSLLEYMHSMKKTSARIPAIRGEKKTPPPKK
jgi:hypothetical protein